MEYSTDLQKEIWLKHIEVQERVLQLNSSPIDIDSDSSQVVGQRLRLRVNQSDIQVNSLLSKIISFFNVTEDAVDSIHGTITCDSCFTADAGALLQLAEECQRFHIHLSKYPVIEGVIRVQESPRAKCIQALQSIGEEYAIDDNGRLQVTVEALRKLEEGSLCPRDMLPNTASGIFSISPTPVYFLRKWLSLACTHHIEYLTGDSRGTYRIRKLSLQDQYLTVPALQILHQLWGLQLRSYDVVMEVPDSISEGYDFKKSLYEFPDLQAGAFHYHFNANNNIQIINGKWQIDLLRSIYNAEFGEGNYSVHIEYNYTYDSRLFHEFLNSIDYSEFFQDLKNKIQDQTISISTTKQSIGIDFDWRITTPEQIQAKLNCQYDDVEVSIFRNHRCNIELNDKYIDWGNVEQFLKENYSSLKLYPSLKDGSRPFSQEYRTTEQASQFLYAFSDSITYLSEQGYECEIHSDPIGVKKYSLRIDYKQIAENKEHLLNSLRGVEFTVNRQSIGKLCKVAYPELVFDISSANYDFSSEGSLTFGRITPNLDGDIEKIKRLQTAFDNITWGEGVQNQNIGTYIFDASKATRTTDIEDYTNEYGTYYQGIVNHLLNSHINPSQLRAIIKCLRAKDIALIQGPPGTGKSTAIAELIWQHIRLNPQERILLTSETNLAVDNAIDRTVNHIHNLVKPIRFGSEDRLASEGRQFSMTAMQEWVHPEEKIESAEEPDELYESEQSQRWNGNVILVNWLENIKNRIDDNKLDPHAASLWRRMLEAPDQPFRELIFEQYKSHCNVVGATCSSIGEKNSRNRPTKFFMDYCSVYGQVSHKTIYLRNEEGTVTGETKEITDYRCEKGISFTTVIQDESSKATPAELVLPLIYGRKNIVIGDHRQLPPMLDKEEFLNTLSFLMDNANGVAERHKLRKLQSYVLRNFNEMEISQFQRIYEHLDDSLKGEFTLQYRMHPDINEVIKQFYEEDKGLECGLVTPVDLGVNDQNLSNPFSRYHGIQIDDFLCGESLSPNNHVLWIDVNSPEMIEGTSRVNEGEIQVIYHMLEKFSESDSFKAYCKHWTDEEDKEIGIISFYSKQRNRIRNICREFNELSLKVDVVDRFQGMERNIIIVSMVRSHTIASEEHQAPDFSEYDLGYPEQQDLGFAQSPNRLNVALSRARRLLIIVGNSELFRQQKIYDNVYKIIEANPNGKIIRCNPYDDFRK